MSDDKGEAVPKPEPEKTPDKVRVVRELDKLKGKR